MVTKYVQVIESGRKKLIVLTEPGELTQEQINTIVAIVIPQIPPPDLSGKVDKITDYSLVPNIQIAKIHLSGSDDQDLSDLVVKVTGSSLVPDTEITKLAGVEAGANNYYHPATHSPSMITQDASNRFVTDAEKTTWNAAGDPFIAKLILSADKPTGANVTPVTLGLSFNYEANSKYVIDIYALVSPAVAGTGCGFMIDVSTAVTYAGTFIVHQLAITGTISGGSSIGDLGVTSQGVSSGMVLAAAAGSNFVYGGGILITGANTGTATFFFRSETTAVTTCKAGTIIRVMKI